MVPLVHGFSLCVVVALLRHFHGFATTFPWLCSVRACKLSHGTRFAWLPLSACAERAGESMYKRAYLPALSKRRKKHAACRRRRRTGVRDGGRGSPAPPAGVK
jgi:hypothetical protein